jgi:hypothetical protein
MRELTFIEKGKLEWCEADDPKLEGDGEAIVSPSTGTTPPRRSPSSR